MKPSSKFKEIVLTKDEETGAVTQARTTRPPRLTGSSQIFRVGKIQQQPDNYSLVLIDEMGDIAAIELSGEELDLIIGAAQLVRHG